MNVELNVSAAEFTRKIAASDNETVVMNQIGLYSSLKSIEFLIDTGITEEKARSMMGQLRECLEIAREEAKKRPNCLLYPE